jgi:hypothetical protein
MNSELFYENETVVRIFFYASIYLVPFGTILNFLQVIVFSTKDFKKSNIGFLMNILTFLETLALIWSIVIFKYLSLIGINVSSYSDLSCVLFLYFVRIIQEIPLYYQAFISFINFISVAYPAKYKSFCKKKNFIFCLIGIIVFNLIANIPNLFRNIIIQNTTNVSTTQICIATNETDLISSIDFSLFRFFVPFIILIALNTLSVRKLIKLRSNLNLSLKKEIRFAKILFVLVWLFCLFNLPLSIVVIIQIVYQYFNVSNSSQLNSINFLIDITRVLAWSYYGFGFLINVVFNRIFRKNFLNIIGIRATNDFGTIKNRRQLEQFDTYLPKYV